MILSGHLYHNIQQEVDRNREVVPDWVFALAIFAPFIILVGGFLYYKAKGEKKKNK